MPAALAAADPLISDPLATERHLDEAIWAGNPNNPDQVTWLAHFRRRARLAAQMPEVRSNATVDPAAHAAWLAAEGWEAQISQGSPADIFLAATLNIAARWMDPGRAYLDRDGIHRAVLKNLLGTGWRSEMVVTVHTKTKYTFLFQQTADKPVTRGDLCRRAAAMATPPTSAYAAEKVHLDFPMIDLRVRDGSSYMLGMRRGDHVVTQACEQLRLEMNELGGRASAAAEVAVTRGFDNTPVVKIDGPFVVAVVNHTAPALDRVMFAAFCDVDSWKRPDPSRI